MLQQTLWDTVYCVMAMNGTSEHSTGKAAWHKLDKAHTSAMVKRSWLYEDKLKLQDHIDLSRQSITSKLSKSLFFPRERENKE